MWSTYIQHYKDPLLVAKIQEFFGIEIHYNNDSNDKNKTSNKSEIEISTKNEKNGLNDTKSSLSINGCFTQESDITTRARHKEVSQSKNDETTATSVEKNSEPYTIKNHFWYYLFLFGTELGDEIFYSLFIPFWLWNIDGSTGRRIVLVWAITMSIGQILKDVICWPRPSCPPAVRLQKKWSLEYGMPSTHAIIAVSIPFSAIFFTKNKYIYYFPVGFIIAMFWCTLICVSRLYLGMHTVLDVIAGLALATITMIFLVPLVDALEHYFVTNTWALLTLLVISIAVLVYYPSSSKKWTPTRGDTALVVSTAVGVQFGFWINYKTGMLTESVIPPPYNIMWPTYQVIGKILLRTVLGFVYILIVKALMKRFVYTTMSAILKVNSEELMKSENSLENKNKILVDLVCKYITCFVITCSMLTLLPIFFTMIDIGRSTFYTEL